jgi:hypothetical protein
MDLKEKFIVNESFLKDKNVYNLNIGGFGGWNYVNKNHNNKLNNRKTGNYGWKIKPIIDENHCKKVSIGLKKYFQHNEGHFSNKKHSNNTKKKIGEITKITQKGSRNSQYGKCWIHNLNKKQNKSINKEELDKWLLDGWIKGRKFIF